VSISLFGLRFLFVFLFFFLSTGRTLSDRIHDRDKKQIDKKLKKKNYTQRDSDK